MKPRCILPNRTYMVTRRTTQRMFLLRPSRQVNACLRYCLALAQRRSGVQVHSVVFLSNHYHIIVSDPDGELPIFSEELNKLIGRSINCHHGWSENLWSANDQTSYVRLENEFDVMAKSVYTLANPVAAGLVSHGSQWPGVLLFQPGDYVAKKPGFFFRKEEDKGPLPDTLSLTLSPPLPGHPVQVTERIRLAVAAREKQLRERAKAKRKKFMGAAAIKAQSIYGSPKSPAKKSGISPRIACRDKWRRIEVLAQLAEFIAEHKAKRLAFVAGVKDALFPPGTYRFVKQFGARCAEC